MIPGRIGRMHTPFCTSQISLHTSQNAPVLALSLGLEIRWTSLRNVRDVIFMVLITWTCRNRSGRSAGCRTKNLTNKNSYTGWPKNLAHLVLCALTSSNIGRFSNLFHCQNQENICNNTVTNDPTTCTSIVSLHYLVKCHCLKSNDWKQDDFCNNTF